MTPEKLHLALNHLPIIGLAFALIPLAVGLLLDNHVCRAVGLSLVLVCGAATALVVETGEEAFERYDKGPVAVYLDAGAKHWMEEHADRAETAEVLLYASAGAALVAFALMRLRPVLAGRASVAVLAIGTAAMLAAVWTADAGGKIRRPDMRGQAGVAAPAAHAEGGDRDDD